METITSPSTAGLIEAKRKTAAAVNRIKINSPSFRDKLRKEFKQYYKQQRCNLMDRFRNLDTIQEEVSSIITDVYNNLDVDECDSDSFDWEKATLVGDPIGSQEFCPEDILKPTDLDNAVDMNELELLYQMNAIIQQKMTEMCYLINLQDCVFCPFCQKGNIQTETDRTRDIWRCDKCQQHLHTTTDRKYFDETVKQLMTKHFQNCSQQIFAKFNNDDQAEKHYKLACDLCEFNVEF